MKLLLAISLYLTIANAFYFYATGGERKCFYKELSQGTLLRGNYRVQALDPNTNQFKDTSEKELGVVLDVEVSQP